MPHGETLVNAEELQRLIASGETQAIEFKQSFAEENEAIKSLGAFANTNGGTVVIGLKDNGSVAPLQLGGKTLEEFANKIRRESQPPLPASIEMMTLEETQ
jgi:ATP-dependent DNA helicase RecG